MPARPDEAFKAGMRELERAYLESNDPVRQSGFSGGRQRWVAALAGWSSSADVDMAEGAGPLMIAVFEPPVIPRGVMADHVMMAAQWRKVVVVGSSALAMGVAVVQVALVGGLAAPWEDTSGVFSSDSTSLVGAGRSPQSPG